MTKNTKTLKPKKPKKSSRAIEDLERVESTVLEAFKSGSTNIECAKCKRSVKYFDVLSSGESICPVCTYLNKYPTDSDCIWHIDSFDPRDPELFAETLKIAEHEKLQGASDKDNFIEVLLPTDIREAVSVLALKNGTGLNEVVIAGLGYFISVLQSKT